MTAKLLRAGYNIVEVPISYQPRSIQEGKKLCVEMVYGSPGHWCDCGSAAGKANSLLRHTDKKVPAARQPWTCRGNVNHGRRRCNLLECFGHAHPRSGHHRFNRCLAGLCIVLLLSLTLLLGCFDNQDMDIWWHLKAGRQILAGQGVPNRDTFTFGANGSEWIDLHWGFQVAAAWIYQWGGFPALDLGHGRVAQQSRWYGADCDAGLAEARGCCPLLAARPGGDERVASTSVPRS